MMEIPSASQITAAGATLAMVLQYFGLVLPTQVTSDSNRIANFQGRDMLRQCQLEREEYLDALLENH
jgi:hypothetical protein